MRPGDVFHLYLDRVGHYKYVICIDPEDNYFLFISTNPPYSEETTVEVDPREIHCLSYPSFIDTSHLKRIGQVRESFERDTSIYRENIRAGVRARIKRSVESHDVMAPWEKQKVLDNL